MRRSFVILSDRRESKDLRTYGYPCGQIGAKIPPRASLGRDDISSFCTIQPGDCHANVWADVVIGPYGSQ